jgi:hypothetical protein
MIVSGAGVALTFYVLDIGGSESAAVTTDTRVSHTLSLGGYTVASFGGRAATCHPLNGRPATCHRKFQ